MILNYLTGTNSASDNFILMKWRKDDPDNELLFRQYQKIWEHCSKLKINFDTEEQWRTLASKLPHDSEIKNKQIYYFKIAAVILPIAAIAFGVWIHYSHPPPFPSKELKSELVAETIIRTQDTVRVVNLSDCTQVCLNKNSTLRFPKTFSGIERVVSVQGEAFFQVHHDAAHPFKVFSNGTRVLVTGTSFNVKDLPDSQVSVSVERGQVKFASDTIGSSEGIILNSGDKGICIKKQGTVIKSKTSEGDFLWWRGRKMEHKVKELFKKLKDKWKDGK